MPFDVESVPTELRHLIPFVQRWGVARPDLDPVLASASPQEIGEFCQAMAQNKEAILDWVTEWTARQDSEVPDAIWRFSFALGSYELAQPLQPPPPRRRDELSRAEALTEDLQLADEAFRLRRFSEVVALLAPHERGLMGTWAQKLRIARERAES